MKSLRAKPSYHTYSKYRARETLLAVSLICALVTQNATAQQRGENEGWFGIRYMSAVEDTGVGALARSNEIFGAKVVFVSKNGPSSDILNVDDVVIQVGRERVTDQSSLQTALRLIGPDQPVDIAVIRNEQLLWLEITTSQPPMLLELPTVCFPFRADTTTVFIWPSQTSFDSFREDVERATQALGCIPDQGVLAKIEGVFNRASIQGLTPHELINFETDLTTALGREIDTVDDWYDENGLPTTAPRGAEKLAPPEDPVESDPIESVTISECIKTLTQISLALEELGEENLAKIVDLKVTLTEAANKENKVLLHEALELTQQHLSEVTTGRPFFVETSLFPKHTYSCWQLSPVLNEVLSIAN